MTTVTDGRTTKALTREEITRFHRDGYLGPYSAVEPAEIEIIRRHVEDEVLTTVGLSKNRGQSRHLDSRVLFDLVSRSAIVDRLDALMGPDIVLWRSALFNKAAGEKNEVPWHQDYKFWPIEPPVNISAWIAIDEVTVENSCVQVIPGSHLDIVPHIPATDGPQTDFKLRAEPSAVPTERAVHMELKPGEFFLFVERLLHHSEPNHSSKRRMGIAGRYTVPFVRVDQERLFPKHHNILLRGNDAHGINRYGEPPRG